VLRWLPETGGPALRSRLRLDILDLASLKHSSLALPCSFSRDPGSGRFYFLRAYVEGSDLASAMMGRAPRDVAPFLTSAAEALGILHRFQIPHGNIKASSFIVPRRALFTRSPDGPKTILCDPAWWPDEQASFASDLRALGAVFYGLLTGRELDPGDAGLPALPSELNPEVPIDLERLVMRLLQPSPDRRYGDAPSLIEDLRRIDGARSRRAVPPPECFLGRKGELERAVAVLAGGAGDSARPRSIAVSGEAGTGKSAFLRRLELEAQLLGYRTASVRCYPEAAPGSALHAIADEVLPGGAAGRGLRARYRRLTGAPGSKPKFGERPPDRRLFLRGLLDLFVDSAGREPIFLVVDEVHLADSLTVDLLASLAREIALEPEDRRLPSFAAAYRAESPFRTVLRPLTEAFRASGESHLAIVLKELTEETVEEWVELAFGGEGAAGARPPAAHAKGLGPLQEGFIASLDTAAREAIEVLAVLGRPASLRLLDAVLHRERRGHRASSRLQPTLDALREEGVVAEERGRFFFQHGSFHSWVLGSLAQERRRDLHGRIARVLEAHGEAVEEVARHWLESDSPRKGLPAALKAARRLARNHEDRRALDFLKRALGLLPAKSATWRKVAREAAEAFGRIGEHRRGIELLEKLLDDPGTHREAAWLHGRLGVFLHRSGEIAEAAAHLEKGLAQMEPMRGSVQLRERLAIESELAEIASNKGDYVQAESLCRRALEVLDRARRTKCDLEVRREEMVLLETLAHLKLRRFQYAEARELFEKSLKAGEALDLIQEKSLLLNNLGTLHVQENRLEHAIECYRQAEKLSERLGDDPSLTAIHSNLAALYAKSGDPVAADASIRRAAAHDARSDSRRTRFVRLHNSGLVDLCLGRYATGIDAFKEAIALGEELKDAFLTAFDLVYLGECHLFRGEAKAAQAAFERAVSRGPAAPAPIQAMVDSRRAVLAALRGELSAARKSCASVPLASPATSAAGIPYLDAWNRLFAGWALRLCGRHADAAAALEDARTFFAKVKVPAGEIHAVLELAALEADRGDADGAEKLLGKLRRRFRPGQGALKNPMLAARLLAYHTRALLERKCPDVEEAAALLVEAESYLIGRRLRDLEGLARELRRRIRARESTRAHAPSLPPYTASDPSAAVELADALKGAAEDLVRGFEELAGEEEARPLRRRLVEFEEHLQEAHRRLEGRDAPARAPFRAGSILGGSAAIRKVVHWIRQAAPTALPVLITGETGTGKELVARALHGESSLRRQKRPTSRIPKARVE